MLPRGRPFKKGQSGNPGGRPRVLADVQDLAREQTPKAISTLVKIMENTKAPAAARVSAAIAIMDRGYGKPTQPIAQGIARLDLDAMDDEELMAIAAAVTPNGNGKAEDA